MPHPVVTTRWIDLIHPLDGFFLCLIKPTYLPPAQSENTKMILDQIDQASNSDTPPISMKAMMAALRSSLENDRKKHIYNAGAYANSLGSYAWEPEESDD
jgi:hypothetical protein